MRPTIEKHIRILDNGMKVILIRKPDFAKSLFMIGIPAGGMNVWEISEKGSHTYPTGCAHFLEHQMFRLDGEDVTSRLAAMQAQANAYTTYTETCYFVTTTADPSEPLKLLMDFVQTLDISEQSVNKEKGIILSEYNIYDTQPENRLIKGAFQALYHNYPLNTDILGKPEDISNMRPEHLQSFYDAYYDPSQLVMVGITGRDAEPLLDLIEEHEKNYPSKTSARARRVFEPEPEACASEHTEFSMDISTPYALMACKLKADADPQQNLRKDFMVNIWLDTLFSSINSEFQTWLDTRLITQVCGAEADFSSGHAYVLVYAQTSRPYAFLEMVKKVLKEDKKLDPESYEALKIQTVANNLRTLDQFDSLAYDQIRGEFIGFDPLAITDMIQTVQLEEIEDYLAKMDFSNCTSLIIWPHNSGKTDLVKEDFETGEEQPEEDLHQSQTFLQAAEL